MTTLIDCSALLALIDGGHPMHGMLRHQLAYELEAEGEVAATNYVVLETCEAARRQLGAGSLKALVRDILPALEIVWVQPAEHELALEVSIASGQESLSMVDLTTVLVARRLGVNRFMAVDERFEEEGLV